MTINEIENTLETLEARHQNLDEVMLITLLTAGGWEEKNIRDAVSIFRNTNGGKRKTQEPLLFTSKEESHLLPEIVDTAHALLEHNPGASEPEIKSDEKDSPSSKEVGESIVTPAEEVKDSELQSLASPTLVSNTQGEQKKGELPDNLPLRPFERTPQVWPLSLYKDVFHGEVKPASVDAKKEIKEKNTNPDESKHSEHSPITGEDEGLIIVAGTMLLVILLILAYMYSNGRL